MRVLIFSDMHGNAIGLEAVLADVRGEAFDQRVCLGDALQGGPQPHQVAQMLRELGCPVVLGNADDWLVTGEDAGAEPIEPARLAKMTEIRHWSLAQLDAGDLALIHTFQPTLEIPLEQGRRLLCYHGSKQSFDHVILPTTPDAEVGGYLAPEEGTIYTGGHTHLQFVRHFGRTFHFNPGSAGFAYRHDQDFANFKADPFAEYAVLTDNQGRIRLEFRRVPFAAEQLIQVYKASDRPYGAEAAAQY